MDKHEKTKKQYAKEQEKRDIIKVEERKKNEPGQKIISIISVIIFLVAAVILFIFKKEDLALTIAGVWIVVVVFVLPVVKRILHK